jgi:hypothetical protein
MISIVSIYRTGLHTGTHLITEVKQRWAHLVLGWVTTKITSMLVAFRRCTRILWPGKASEKTPKGVIPPLCVKYRRTPEEKTSQSEFLQFLHSFRGLRRLSINRNGHNKSPVRDGETQEKTRYNLEKWKKHKIVGLVGLHTHCH